jgi:hypothetical protein
MRIIAVERIDKIYGRRTYDTYEFPDNTTNDEIATNKELCDAFDEFVNEIPTSVVKADGHTVDECIDACEWWFYDITDELREEEIE